MERGLLPVEQKIIAIKLFKVTQNLQPPLPNTSNRSMKIIQAGFQSTNYRILYLTIINIIK